MHSEASLVDSSFGHRHDQLLEGAGSEGGVPADQRHLNPTRLQQKRTGWGDLNHHF